MMLIIQDLILVIQVAQKVVSHRQHFHICGTVLSITEEVIGAIPNWFLAYAVPNDHKEKEAIIHVLLIVLNTNT